MFSENKRIVEFTFSFNESIVVCSLADCVINTIQVCHDVIVTCYGH